MEGPLGMGPGAAPNTENRTMKARLLGSILLPLAAPVVAAEKKPEKKTVDLGEVVEKLDATNNDIDRTKLTQFHADRKLAAALAGFNIKRHAVSVSFTLDDVQHPYDQSQCEINATADDSTLSYRPYYFVRISKSLLDANKGDAVTVLLNYGQEFDNNQTTVRVGKSETCNVYLTNYKIAIGKAKEAEAPAKGVERPGNVAKSAD